MPEGLAVGQIVANHFARLGEPSTANSARSGGNNLCAVAVFHDGGRGPSVAALAIFFPKRFAVCGINHLDGRLPCVIAHDYETSIVDHRRTAFTKERAHHRLPEIAFPEFFAVEIVAVQASRTEPAVEAFAVGGG